MRSSTKIELKTDEEARACDICGRTILKGERTEVYLAPGGRRKTVCELCSARADHEGWIREAAHADLPATRAPRPPRRGFVSRIRGAFAGDGDGELDPDAAGAGFDERPVFADEAASGEDAAAASEPAVEPRPERERERERPRARDGGAARRAHRDRHIRAVPTTAEVKVERALELFNESDHPRTIAGIARTLGAPWVHASPDTAQPSEVTIVVAWELSWYRYRVDLGDEHEPLHLLEKGDELSELEEPLRSWNAVADENGRLGAQVGSAP